MKKETFFSILVFFLFVSCTKHSSLREKYPDRLFSDDFGILLEKDLLEAGNVGPLGPLAVEMSPDPRWFCFKINSFKSKCNNSDEKLDNMKEHGGDFEVTIRDDGKSYKYYSRKVISYDVCEEHRAAWKKLIDGEKNFCISGTMMAVDPHNPNLISAAFHSLKTLKGCDSWFIGDCK